MAQASSAVVKAPSAEGKAQLNDLPVLFKQLAGDVTEMASARIDLLKVEAKQEVTRVVTSGAGIMTGGLIALVGFVFASVALAFGLAWAFLATGFSSAGAYGLGLAITGTLFLIVGVLVIFAMKKRLVDH